MSGETVGAELDVGMEDDAHDVVFLCHTGICAVFDACDVPFPSHDSLGEEESGREFEIVAGGSHGHGKRRRLALVSGAALHADFHRLLHREAVRLLPGSNAAYLPHGCGRRRSRSFHDDLSGAGIGSMRTRAL